MPDAETLAVGMVAVVLVLLVVVPVVSLVWRSLTPGGSLSLDAYRAAFGGVPFGEVLLTTAAFALGATAVGVGLGSALAVALFATDVPGRRVLLLLAVAPLLLPGVLQTMSWIFLLAPVSGALSGIPGVPSVFGLGGMILVEGLRLAPLALLLVGAALRSGDRALEEAAVVAGAGRLAVLWRVTLPLLRPALAAAVVLLAVRTLGSFEVPTLLGEPERTWVFTSRVWLALGAGGGGLPVAAAGSVPLLVLTALGSVALMLLLRRPRSGEVVSGREHRRARIELGLWRFPVLLGCTAYVVLAVVLPLLALVWMSTQPFLTPLSGEALGRADLSAYTAVVHDERIGSALRNSILYAGAAALVACALAAVVAWVAVRSRSARRHVLDGLAFLPLAVPGLVLGVALLGVFVRSPVALYGTAAALVLGYVARYLPYASRLTGGGVARVGRELEDAARISGIGWWPTLTRIVLPLAGASLLAAATTVFAIALTDVSLSLVLYAPGTEVLGVRIWSLYQDGQWSQLAALGVLTSSAVLALGLGALALGGTAARGCVLSVERVAKRFPTRGGEVHAVREATLDVAEGSFVTLLGASGSGKTTLLRCVAGLERPDSGRIAIGGTVVSDAEAGLHVPPERRGIGMVFQSPTVWPHMTVHRNVAFPLRHLPRAERPRRADADRLVQDALRLVRLEGLDDRPATDLSGGQQQRLALARALVRRPRVLLLDEPLSALDADLREDIGAELRRIQQELGVTTVYVTHDRDEACALSTEVAVVRDGTIEQVGTPQRLYERPATSFVARALGPANLIAGRVREASNGTVVVDTASGALRIPAPELPLGAGAEVLVVARPEHVRVERDGPDAVVSAAFARDVVELVVQSGTATVRARVAGDAAPEPGAAVTVAFDEPRLSLVPADADAR